MFTQLNINAGLAFSAFAVAVFCLVSSLRKNLSRVQHATYLIICISCVVCPLTGIFEEVFTTFGKEGDGLYWPFLLSEFVFFAFHTFLAPSFGLYVLSLNGTLVGRKKTIWFLYWTPVFLAEFFNIANLFFPMETRPIYTVLITSEGGYLYHRGDFLVALYVLAFLYVAYSLYAFIRNIRAVNTKKIVSLSLFYSLVIVGVVLQSIWADVKFETLFESMAILGLLLLLESDNEIINQNTGLYNEIAFFNDNATAMAARRKYTIITIKSPDYFQFLEMLGNASYNAIEIEISRFLTSVCKAQYVYHLTNGAFGITVYENGKDEIDHITQRLEERFKEPWGHGDIEVSPKWSITVASVPHDIDDPGQLHYLFITKNTKTQNKVDVRKSISLQFIKRRSQIEGAIARGLKNNNFKLFYQPIWDAKRNKIVSAEGLLRLIDPELGFIGPDEFIPVAEENGTIIDLGHWVFEEACRFARNNEVQNLGIEWIEINLSVYQLPEKDLPGRFLETAHRYGIQPSFINIEVTETAEADNNAELVERIQNLAKVGFPLSLDDYGTGYSNLTRLMTNKFKNIKLDRSLLLSAEEGEVGQAVLASTYETMNSLSFHTIQEGVETEEQKNLVIKFGAEMIQGFLFSKPIPERDFVEYVMKFNKIQYID
ncbi:MAG: EAL domain-containing protein [Bacilli bacterium]|nr:EAL domain-containing protein [Bacilli bacterium]